MFFDVLSSSVSLFADVMLKSTLTGHSGRLYCIYAIQKLLSFFCDFDFCYPWCLYTCLYNCFLYTCCVFLELEVEVSLKLYHIFGNTLCQLF